MGEDAMNALQDQSGTVGIVAPILTATYGASSYVDAFARFLAEKIDGRDWDSRGREHMIMSLCWDWFSGGTLAARAAAKIDAALGEEDTR
jgi:hypothetical protein